MDQADALVKGKTGNDCAAAEEHQCEGADVPEGKVDILHFLEHGIAV
jgi:hypothetical protein